MIKEPRITDAIMIVLLFPIVVIAAVVYFTLDAVTDWWGRVVFERVERWFKSYGVEIR